ncbi:Protein singed [Eumeta japonica]|uniref:Protein singed n=1 Tax=Eumeta variegata TaxID=151549 RepID=A0A4C1UWI8_EUMVA|nr:Protein singed [Eumeta japonica]
MRPYGRSSGNTRSELCRRVPDSVAFMSQGRNRRSSNALFELEWQGDGSVAFRANSGKYLLTKRSGHLYASADAVDDNCKYYFYLINRSVPALLTHQSEAFTVLRTKLCRREHEARFDLKNLRLYVKKLRLTTPAFTNTYYHGCRPILVLKCEQGFVGPKGTRLECNKAGYETVQVVRGPKGAVYFKGNDALRPIY